MVDGSSYKIGEIMNEVFDCSLLEAVSATESDSLTVVEGYTGYYHDSAVERNLWLLNSEGVPVVFMNVLDYDDREEVSLLTVEVREEYRGNHLAVRAVRTVESFLNKQMTCDGQYTYAGYCSLGKLFHSKRFLSFYEPEDFIDPQDFVKDWDTMTPMFIPKYVA